MQTCVPVDNNHEHVIGIVDWSLLNKNVTHTHTHTLIDLRLESEKVNIEVMYLWSGMIRYVEHKDRVL